MVLSSKNTSTNLRVSDLGQKQKLMFSPCYFHIAFICFVLNTGKRVIILDAPVAMHGRQDSITSDHEIDDVFGFRPKSGNRRSVGQVSREISLERFLTETVLGHGIHVLVCLMLFRKSRVDIARMDARRRNPSPSLKSWMMSSSSKCRIGPDDFPMSSSHRFISLFMIL